MSDHTPDNQDTLPEIQHDDAIDTSRRKLTGAALGAGAVFTLASRPVWANQCTISGMQSGNLSKTTQETCDGCTPGYWMQCQHLDEWVGYRPDDYFNAVFGCTQYVNHRNHKPYTLLDVMGLTGNTDPKKADCKSMPDGYAVNPMGKDPISPNLGFHTVAALLNAAHPRVNFGYTPGDIIVLFQKNYLSNPAALKDAFVMLNERGCPLN